MRGISYEGWAQRVFIPLPWRASTALWFWDGLGFRHADVTHVVAPLFLGSRNDFFALDAVRLAGSADSYRRERGVESLPLHGGMDELSVHGKYFLEYEILAANGAVEFLRERPEGLPFPHSLPFLWFQSANFAGWDRKRQGVS